MNITRTGKMVPFLSINIGSPFFAHDRVWIRTAYEAATELNSTPIREEGKLMLSSCCNFNIDECDREVEAVEFSGSREFYDPPTGPVLILSSHE